MTLPKPSELMKLAKACRKAGITKFKSGDFEFELGDEPQPKSSNIKQLANESQGDVETDRPDDETLLFWSVTDTPSSSP
jgi:hypothetical protein